MYLWFIFIFMVSKAIKCSSTIWRTLSKSSNHSILQTMLIFFVFISTIWMLCLFFLFFVLWLANKKIIICLLVHSQIYMHISIWQKTSSIERKYKLILISPNITIYYFSNFIIYLLLNYKSYPGNEKPFLFILAIGLFKSNI